MELTGVHGVDFVKIKRALVSVSDKVGVVELAQKLADFGVEIISTGGTARTLKQAGVPVVMVEEWTRFPECFGGRLKTLSPAIYGGLLYRRDNPSHVADAARLGMPGIDMVVCNLYPFEKHVAAGSADDELVENIDIGGPCMIRAAAKNFDSVLVCVDPTDYRPVLAELEANEGAVSHHFRRRMAARAFASTAAYDSAIAAEFSARFTKEGDHQGRTKLRYGENPHQAAFLLRNGQVGVAGARVIQGKELSWNNLLDADSAWRLASDLHRFASDSGNSQVCPGVAIIKHGNPCGASVSSELTAALESAWAQDPVSAFGGVLAFTSLVTGAEAEFLAERFVEVVLAPGYDQAALKILAGKKNVRVLELPLLQDEVEWQVRSISGGQLLQQEDNGLDLEWFNATQAAFPPEKKRLASFSVILAKHLKSNAIVLAAKTANGFEMVGAGMGQPNRIDSLVRLALPRAQGNLDRLAISEADLVLASDAFFPFADTVTAAAEAGIRFIVQPGGSVRDQEVVDACNRLGVAMALTGRRHFRH
ncbi:MAG: bifunctional purine biosynthesis protein PurH [Pseudomonadota bacterium]